jgi:hypothetical protein
MWRKRIKHYGVIDVFVVCVYRRIYKLQDIAEEASHT